MKIHELCADENSAKDAGRSSSVFSYNRSWCESDEEGTFTQNPADIPEFVYMWILQHLGNINNSNNDMIPVADDCDKENKDDNGNEDDVLHPSFIDLDHISTDQVLRFSPQFESQDTGTRKMSSSLAWNSESPGNSQSATVRTLDYSSDFEVFSSIGQLAEKASNMSRYTEFSSRPTTVLSWPLSTPRSDILTPRSPVKSKIIQNAHITQKSGSPTAVGNGSPDGNGHQNRKTHNNEISISPVKGEVTMNKHNWEKLSQETHYLPASSQACDSKSTSSRTFEIGSIETFSPPKKKVMKNVRHPAISNALELDSSNHKEDFALPPLRNVSLELRHRKAGQEHDHHGRSRISTSENITQDSKQKGKMDTTELTAKSSNSTKKKRKKCKEKEKNRENVVNEKSEEDPSGELSKNSSSSKRKKLKLPQIANMPAEDPGRTSIWQRILAHQTGNQADFTPLMDCEPAEVNDNDQR